MAAAHRSPNPFNASLLAGKSYYQLIDQVHDVQYALEQRTERVEDLEVSLAAAQRKSTANRETADAAFERGVIEGRERARSEHADTIAALELKQQEQLLELGKQHAEAIVQMRADVLAEHRAHADAMSAAADQERILRRSTFEKRLVRAPPSVETTPSVRYTPCMVWRISQ